MSNAENQEIHFLVKGSVSEPYELSFKKTEKISLRFVRALLH